VIFLLALLPATALTIAGYFVLYLSARTEGALRTFGKYLGFWAFTLAGLVILGALFAAAHGGHRGNYAMRGMHGMHCPWGGSRSGPRSEERGEPRAPGEEPRERGTSPPAGVPSPAATPNTAPPDTH
jgi:hypothetical protein